MNIKDERKVSIVIPYYNNMEFIGDCLNSIYAQSYSNLEIIIINDGSNQKNSDHIETLLNEKRIKYLLNDSRQGVAYSRNKGIEAATGDYIFFLDSDDLLAENAIRLLVDHIEEYPVIAGRTKRLLRPSDLVPPAESPELNIKFKKSKTVFKTGSILNVLIKRGFIKEQNLKFDTETEGSTDITGIMPFIISTEEMPVVNLHTYYKRVRNDPITNPSLVQRSPAEKARDFLQVYKKLAIEYQQNDTVKSFLDRLFLKYYRKQVISIFKDPHNYQGLFELFSSAVDLMNKKLISDQAIHIRTELKQLQKGNLDKFRKSLKWHMEARDFKNALKGRTALKKYIYRKVFLARPMKDNYIVFESFLGKNYSDSPRNIYEYIIEHNLDYKCIWVFNYKNRKVPGNAKVVKRFSLAYYYYFAVSKYWVNNMRQPLHLVKREGNILLETWHGTPLKKLVFDMKDVYSANPRYKRDFYMQSRAWDYLLSPNRYSSDVFKSAFKFDKEMLEFGYPRNDILYSPNRDAIAVEIKESIGIPKNKKVVLYAPTWRDDDYYKPGKYKFDLKLDLQKMREKLGDEYVVALRMHYFIADDLNIEGMEGFAFNLSKYDDIAHLYLISDILITDYSSVFFDYANLKRPILFYTYDLEKYRDQLRGFYIDFENEGPGPLLRTSEDVINALENIEQIKADYSQKYESFYDKFCSWHDGNSTKKVVEKVFLENK